MFDLCKLIVGTVTDLLRSRAMLEAEILLLRQQINVLRRANPKRLRFASIDRPILGGIRRLFPRCMMHLQSSDPIPWSAGSAPVLGCIGAGNRDAVAVDQRCRWRSAG
jgi:hypothetical protein